MDEIKVKKENVLECYKRLLVECGDTHAVSVIKMCLRQMFPELFEGDSEYDKYIKNKLSGQVEEEKKEQWGTSVPEQYAEQLRKENKEFSEKIDRIRVAQQEWFKEEEKKREKKESEKGEL